MGVKYGGYGLREVKFSVLVSMEGRGMAVIVPAGKIYSSGYGPREVRYGDQGLRERRCGGYDPRQVRYSRNGPREVRYDGHGYRE